MIDVVPRKRSQIVLLTLLGLPMGAIALADAFPGHEMRRNLYADQAACERDYSPTQCQRSTVSSGGGTATTWHGPYYYGSRGLPAATSDPGPGRTGVHAATEVSMRGGFGHFGRAGGFGRGG